MNLAHPLAAILIPLLGAAAIIGLRRWPRLRDAVGMACAVLLLACVAALAARSLGGAGPPASVQHAFLTIAGADGSSATVSLGLHVAPLGLLFALVAAGLWPLNALYALGYVHANDEPRRTCFHASFAVALACVMGIAFAADLLTLFVFYEALTFSTYPLVNHQRSAASQRGARRYLGILVGSSVGLLLPGLLGIWLVAGSLGFRSGGVFPAATGSGLVTLLYVVTMFGIGKCALLPLHGWLPAAMVAPTPVSALLHAVAVVKAGVFTAMQVTVSIFGLERLAEDGAGDLIAVAAGLTIVVASMIALFQDNLKRRLAYSTISQLSYVVLGAALAHPLALLGAGLHLAAHAVGKITLFFAAGCIYTAQHKTLVSELDGLAWRMPWTFAAFAVGALSMIGMPLLAGSHAKSWLLAGAAGSGLPAWFVPAVLLVSGLLNAAYLLPIVHKALMRPPPAADGHHAGEAPFGMLVAVLATALATIVLGCWPEPLLGLLREVPELQDAALPVEGPPGLMLMKGMSWAILAVAAPAFLLPWLPGGRRAVHLVVAATVAVPRSLGRLFLPILRGLDGMRQVVFGELPAGLVREFGQEGRGLAGAWSRPWPLASAVALVLALLCVVLALHYTAS